MVPYISTRTFIMWLEKTWEVYWARIDISTSNYGIIEYGDFGDVPIRYKRKKQVIQYHV